MKFSIVTPVLNGMPALRRCVGSVRGQGDVDREHLIQDGGSTDGSAEWLRGQAGLTVRSEADGGMYDAINRGWARAGGDVLAWLNADEQYLPGALGRVRALLDSRPEVDAVFGDAIIVDGTGEPVAARREIPLRAVYVRNGFLYALSCTLFFRRRLQDRGWLHFDERYRIAGDMDLVLRLLRHGCVFAHLPAYQSLFGVDGANLSTRPGMAAETAEIRRLSGGLRWAAARRLVMTARYAERLARGCYGRRLLSYDFAVDEQPEYRRVAAGRLGTRFTYAGFMKRRRTQ